MYNDINTFIKTFISSVNSGISGTSNDFREVDSHLDSDNLSANLSDKTYQIKIDSVDVMDFESMVYEIKVNLELWFLVANDITNYKTAIDTYIKPLIRKLKQGYVTEYTNFSVNEVKEIKVNGLNKIVQGGNYLNPVISLTLTCIDSA